MPVPGRAGEGGALGAVPFLGFLLVQDGKLLPLNRWGPLSALATVIETGKKRDKGEQQGTWENSGN